MKKPLIVMILAVALGIGSSFIGIDAYTFTPDPNHNIKDIFDVACIIVSVRCLVYLVESGLL